MQWRNETRKVNDLKPAKYNPRKMNAKQKADLNDSLTSFNLVDPLIVNADGTVIGGHQRLALLKAKNIDEVDVRVPDRQLSEKEEQELNLRLNKNQGEFDLGLLTAFDPAMLVTAGFDGDMVDSLFELTATEDDYDVDDAVKKIETPQTIEGDIYEFPGGHRLMCGSATEFDHVEKLMNGKLADLCYMDPPCGVNYKSQSLGEIKNDGIEDLDQLLSLSFLNAFAHSHEHANIYSWFAMSNYSHFRSAMESAGWRYMQVIQWLKERFVLSMGWYYHRITEPCMIGYKDWKKKFVNVAYAKNHDMWQVDRLTFEENLEVIFQHRDANKNMEHPTSKPIRLHERALKKNSEINHIVLDLFAGGGSTLLCCHQLQRISYNMELDPKFCDVIVDRFTKMTGQKPKLI